MMSSENKKDANSRTSRVSAESSVAIPCDSARSNSYKETKDKNIESVGEANKNNFENVDASISALTSYEAFFENENNANRKAGISLKPWCVVMRITFPYNTRMLISDLPEGLPFDLLRRLLAVECCDRVKNIKLSYRGKNLKSGQTPKRIFRDLRTVPEIECHFKHPSRTTKIHLGRRTLKLSRTDQITVYIYKGDDSQKDKQPDNLNIYFQGADAPPHIVQINWMAENPKRPFLGGYRRKTDNLEFHNANSQTFPHPIHPRPVPVFSRETQTYEMKHAGQTTVKVSSTQMTKVGFYTSNLEDRLISPRPYETADEYLARLERCAILIQRNVRGWLARRKAARFRRLRDLYRAHIEEEERKYQEEKAGRFQRDYDRRANPKRRADFDRLFNALEEWRKVEISKIYKNSSTVAERKANMGLLVDREVELIAKISEHQIEISKYGRLRQQEHYLEKAAETNRWTAAHSQELVEKDTPNTLRAKELLTIYENLKSDCLSKSERMDLLLTVKKLVGKCPSFLSCDLVTLVEREAELLLRHTPTKMLVGLRQRIVQRFIQFCKNVDNNPSVADFLPIPNKKIPGAREKMWDDTHGCRSCGRYLRTVGFDVSARATHLDVCTFCWRQGNRGRARIDREPYRLILQELQEKEARIVLENIEKRREYLHNLELKALDDAVEQQHRERLIGEFQPTDVNELFKADDEEPITETKVVPMSDRLELLVNVQDIFFLVSEIWDNKSALSGCSDLADLTLCRWRVNEPWSPWNTWLLTRKEADLHTKLKSIPRSNLYADAILTRVRQRLVIAKNAFKRLCPVGQTLTQERWELRNKLRNPEDTIEFRILRRHKRRDDGKPLYILTREQRHEATIQPPNSLLPVIEGELEMKDLGIESLKEVWFLPETVKRW